MSAIVYFTFMMCLSLLTNCASVKRQSPTTCYDMKKSNLTEQEKTIVQCKTEQFHCTANKFRRTILELIQVTNALEMTYIAM